MFVAGKPTKWPTHQSTVAAALSVLFVVSWRLTSNALRLNDDFVPAVSLGDLGCLVVGALGPGMVAYRHPDLVRPLPMVVTGALAAFIANVVIL